MAKRYFWGWIERAGFHDPTATIERSLAFLSNFRMARITIDGKEWPSTEHYYQAQKFIDTDPALAERIRTAPTPAKAKALASPRSTAGKLRPDWDTARVSVMRRALRAKFTQHPDLRRQLLATAPATLHEDAPKDPFWGVSGKDKLGKLLCELRDELEAEAPAP